MKKIIIFFFSIVSVYIFFGCNSSEQQQFEYKSCMDKSNQGKANAKQRIYKKRYINPEYSTDTIFIKVFTSKYNRQFYMSAEIIHKGNKIYRKIMIWEIKLLLYIFIENRPYGNNSWKEISSMRSWGIFKNNWYARPMLGEELKKIKNDFITAKKGN